MAKILFLAPGAKGYALAQKFVEQNNEVDFYFPEGRFREVGNGQTQGFKILHTPPNGHQAEYHLIIPTMVGMGRLGDRYRKAGKTVLGGGALRDFLITDPEFGLKVCKLVNLESTPKNQSGTPTHIEGWFNGQSWCKQFIHTFLNTRLMDGGRGPETECMGSVSWCVNENKLISNYLIPLEGLLRKAHYTGPFGINLEVTSEEVFFDSFTTNFLYDQIYSLGELLKGDWYSFLQRVAIGAVDELPLTLNRYAISVRLSIPPYPYTQIEVPKGLGGIQLMNTPEKANNHIYLSHQLDGVIGCFTAWGVSIREAQRRVYRTIKNSNPTQEVQYRSDIGNDAEGRIKLLGEWLNA